MDLFFNILWNIFAAITLAGLQRGALVEINEASVSDSFYVWLDESESFFVTVVLVEMVDVKLVLKLEYLNYSFFVFLDNLSTLPNRNFHAAL